MKSADHRERQPSPNQTAQVDVSLIDWMLDLDAEQRIKALQSWVAMAHRLSHGR